MQYLLQGTGKYNVVPFIDPNWYQLPTGTEGLCAALVDPSVDLVGLDHGFMKFSGSGRHILY